MIFVFYFYRYNNALFRTKVEKGEEGFSYKCVFSRSHLKPLVGNLHGQGSSDEASSLSLRRSAVGLDTWDLAAGLLFLLMVMLVGGR